MSDRRVLAVSVAFIAVAVLATQFSTTDKGVTVSPEKPENIVYISVDALSREHLQCYGYERPTAPNICGLEGATVYTNAYATSHWTPISLGSMQRGVYAHKANLVNKSTPLNSSYYSIADLLNRSGYRTFGLSDHASMSQTLGFYSGFQRAESRIKSSKLPYVPEKFGEELSSENLYFRMHIIGSHDPYIPSQGFSGYNGYRFIEDFNRSIAYLPRRQRSRNISDSIRSSLINHYDENIRYADRFVGEFIAELKDRGEYSNSLIIITADHGESFNDYGEDTWLHEEPNPSVARIPLLIKYPGSESRKKDSELVSHMDPFRIIMNEVGLNLSYQLDAIDPRYEDRKLHYTYIKREEFAVTNRTHLVWTGDFETWNRFRVDEKAEKISGSLDDLKDRLRDFRREVFSRDYRLSKATYSEERRKSLEKLGIPYSP